MWGTFCNIYLSKNKFSIGDIIVSKEYLEIGKIINIDYLTYTYTVQSTDNSKHTIYDEDNMVKIV